MGIRQMIQPFVLARLHLTAQAVEGKRFYF